MAVADMSQWQIESDRRLLNFDTYEEYLDSLVANEDMFYLRGAEPRILAELGYRSTGETLTRETFRKRRETVWESLHPSRLPSTVDHRGIQIRDPLLRELALRERPNRVGVLATIIHLHLVTPLGYELSGYIDFRDRLRREGWTSYFSAKRKFSPTKQDLGMYHWRTEKAFSKNSPNFKVLHSLAHGMDFLNRQDRLVVHMDPMSPVGAGANSTRTRVHSPMFKHAVLYDHVVRQAS